MKKEEFNEIKKLIKMLVEEEKSLIESELKNVPTVSTNEFDYACKNAKESVEPKKDALLTEIGSVSPQTKDKVKEKFNANCETLKAKMSSLAVTEYQLKKFIQTYGVPGGKPISKKAYLEQIDDEYGQTIGILEADIDSLVKDIKKIGDKTKLSFFGKLGYILDQNKEVKKHGERAQETEKEQE